MEMGTITSTTSMIICTSMKDENEYDGWDTIQFRFFITLIIVILL
jgi:hypothetical protein